jgi:hypothetical protein
MVEATAESLDSLVGECQTKFPLDLLAAEAALLLPAHLYIHLNMHSNGFRAAGQHI